MLLDSSDSDSEDSRKALHVNPRFAKKYESQQRFKELQRTAELEAELGEEDSESTSEDDDAEALSPEMDIKIFNTIKSIRENDPKLYDKNQTWFARPSESDDDSSEDEGPAAKQKRKTYKDVVREQLLQGEAGSGSSDEEYDGIDQKTKSIAYNKEQQDMRKSLLKSLKKANTVESSDDDEDILKVKKKTPEEEEAEKAALKNVLDEVLDANSDNAPSKDKFLYDYMLNKKWNFPNNQVASRHRNDGSDSDIVEEDEEEIDREENFESKYNFRFEELQGSSAAGGGPVMVMGHSRAVDGSVRRVDDKRKKTREARKERKEKERRQKEAELRRLKNLKRQELQEKLAKIMKMGGLDAMTAENIMLNADVLDDDWDPVKHEEQMNQQFGDNYYAANETDEEFAARLGQYSVEGEDGAEYGDDDYRYEEGGDTDYNTSAQATAEQDEEGEMDPKKLMESMYKLDYEDIVAGIPCRFKYKQVEPENFGLSAEDVLFADDAELNKYVGLKKLAPYRFGKGIKDEVKLAKKRKRLREAIKERLEVENETPTTPREASAAAATHASTAESAPRNAPEPAGDNSKSKRKRRPRNKKSKGSESPVNVVLINKDTTGGGLSKGGESDRKKVHRPPKKQLDPVEANKARRLSLYS